jgi:sphingomyelin phosphodiesterase acid-like 3
MSCKNLLFIFLLLPAMRLSAQSRNEVLCISDMHFTPFNDRSASSFFKQSHTKWHFTDTAFAAFGQDANYRLIDNMMSEMAQEHPNPNYIIVTGDFLGHPFAGPFDKQCGGCSDGERKAFIAQTFGFISDSFFRKYFPSTTFIPALGNNDAYTGNYSINPDCSKMNIPCDSDFLSMIANNWAALLYPVKDGEGKKKIIKEFSKAGYYTYIPPGEPDHKIIVLNTVLFSANYTCNSCDADAMGNKINTAANEELKWLDDELASCRSKHQSVWIVYHIPPGVDYQEKLQWKPAYNNRFIQLLEKYSETITANFAGHSHMDEFRVFSEGDKAFSFVHVTPSFSTDHKNNPAFQVLTYSHSKYRLLTQETDYFNLAAGRNWGRYNMEAVYGIDAINEHTLSSIVNKDDFQAKYLLHYYTNSQEYSRKKADTALWTQIKFGITNYLPRK